MEKVMGHELIIFHFIFYYIIYIIKYYSTGVKFSENSMRKYKKCIFSDSLREPGEHIKSITRFVTFL